MLSLRQLSYGGNIWPVNAFDILKLFQLRLIRQVSLLIFLLCTCISGHILAENAIFVPFIEHQQVVSVDTSKSFEADTSALDTLSSDSLVMDSIFMDTIVTWYDISPDSLDAIINYKSVDSIVYDIDSGKTYIYLSGEVTYTSFFLKADYIEFDWETKTLTAKQLVDSAGVPGEAAYFQDGDDTFTAEGMHYNFATRNGKIYNLKRQEGEGYVYVDQGKKNAENEYYGLHTVYTTCDLDHPHFYIAANKAKIVPKKIAVTGPANLVVADVPTPLFLPFGIFPINQGRTSGILIPQYGYSFTQGYFLRNGGYYFAINDNFDLSLTGDIYSNASYRLQTSSGYAKRYKYRGNLSLEYSKNNYGLDFDPNFSSNRGFFVRWNHSQDPKARPGSSFAANASFGTSDFLANNSFTESYLNNSYNSSISYNKSFTGSPFTMSAALRHSQNTSTGLVDLTLPDVSLNMSRIYPLKKVLNDPRNQLNQFGISYSMNFRNFLSVPDSTLFTPESLAKMENGFSHNFSASSPFKLLRYFTLTPSFTYNENWYFETVRKNYEPDTIVTEVFDPVSGELTYDTAIVYFQTDTISGFDAARWFNASASLTTKLYGIMQFKRGKVKAIRHVVTPSVSFSYRPDFSDPEYGYYGSYYPSPGAEAVTYSIFEGALLGGPPNGKSGSIGINLANNFEMKVRDETDTLKGERKVKLIDNLILNTAYNLAADSLNWSFINGSAYTTLFNKLRVNVSGSFDPYVLDSTGRRINQFEWDVNDRLARFSTGNVALSTSLRSKRRENENLETTAGTEAERDMVWSNPSAYIDYELPWQMTLNYNLRIQNIQLTDGTDSIATTQTFNLSGDVSLTPNWKVQVSTGYDLQLKDFTYTAIDIYRNLHCWEMSFHWVPFGARQSYLFNINVKASVLQDLKLTRKRDWNEYSF